MYYLFSSDKTQGVSVVRDICLEQKTKGDTSNSMPTNIEQHNKHQAMNTPDSNSFHGPHCGR